MRKVLPDGRVKYVNEDGVEFDHPCGLSEHLAGGPFTDKDWQRENEWAQAWRDFMKGDEK